MVITIIACIVLCLIVLWLVLHVKSTSIEHMTGTALDRMAEIYKLKRVYYGKLEPKLKKSDYFYDQFGLYSDLYKVNTGYFESDNCLRKRINEYVKGEKVK